MMSRSDKADLGESLVELVDSVGHLLEPDGWTERARSARLPVPRGLSGYMAIFERALPSELVAVLALAWARGEDEVEAPVSVFGFVGVVEPGARDLVALGDIEIDAAFEYEVVVAASIERAASMVSSELVARFAKQRFEALSEVGDLDWMVERLVRREAVAVPRSLIDMSAIGVVELGGTSIVEPYPSSDGERSEPFQAKAEVARCALIAAAYAAAGRGEEARRSLIDCQPVGVEPAIRDEFARFARRLIEYLDRGQRGTPPRAPEVDPPLGTSSDEREKRQRQPLEEVLARGAARRDAISAVRAVSEGKDRDQLRELLSRELELRNLQMHSQVLDATVDMLAMEHEPFGALRLRLRGAKALGKLVQSWRNQPAPTTDDED